jgi:K+-sensing histidine kinase KdpD
VTDLWMSDPQAADRSLAGAAIGGLATLVLAALMVPLRDHVENANLALALVLPVLLAAVTGGRISGIVAAVVAAASFDFFFTRPYSSLNIDSRNDVETMVVLVIVALVVAEIGTRSRQLRRQQVATRAEVDRVHRIAELAAHGAAPGDVLAAVKAELIALLDLDDCTYEAFPDGAAAALPRLGSRGAIEGRRVHRWARGELALPTGGVELPVVGAGRQLGRLVLDARPATPASLEQRMVAVVLADELGVSMASWMNPDGYRTS